MSLGHQPADGDLRKPRIVGINKRMAAMGGGGSISDERKVVILKIEDTLIFRAGPGQDYAVGLAPLNHTADHGQRLGIILNRVKPDPIGRILKCTKNAR